MARTACGLVAVALFAATSAIAQTPSWTPPRPYEVLADEVIE
jgi:hypothetical protein